MLWANEVQPHRFNETRDLIFKYSNVNAQHISILVKFSLFFWLAGGLELFLELLQRFPNNIHLLLEMAKVPHNQIIVDFCL